MSNKKNSLKKYKEKRDFSKTPEPKAQLNPTKTKKHKDPIFVVHKHDARNLHYDLRLEDQGVLKSWAVPKGPSTNPQDKRLAMRTEDHPFDYGSFEGVIPQGEYGAGPVMIWDTGTFKNLKAEKLSECIEKGEVAVWLDGQKLKGGYALVRTNYQNKESWLLIKMNDKEADREHSIIEDKPSSVVSDRTIQEIKKIK